MGEAYRRAGVDLDAAARAVALIGELAGSASRPEVVAGVGGFAGLFRIGGGRLLAAATDGVGTKVEIGRRTGRLDGLGIDLVAMCANDVVCTGAEPLFFLDYLAVGRLDPEGAAALVSGVAEGCRRAGCALLGGETAEHPGVLDAGRFDLAGFCVGIVNEDDLLGPDRVEDGDVLIGLPSTGLHSNGFSLVRRLLDASGIDLATTPSGLDRPLADELLEPTAIYVPAVLAAARRGSITSAAHITGGGIAENLPRALPHGLRAELDKGSWEAPAVFRWVQALGGIPDEEMFATFNMGLGLVAVARRANAGAAVRSLGEGARIVGGVAPGEGVTLG